VSTAAFLSLVLPPRYSAPLFLAVTTLSLILPLHFSNASQTHVIPAKIGSILPQATRGHRRTGRHLQKAVCIHSQEY
jgi:hypothetical protein